MSSVLPWEEPARQGGLEGRACRVRFSGGTCLSGPLGGTRLSGPRCICQEDMKQTCVNAR
jgi:hypothetical protein